MSVDVKLLSSVTINGRKHPIDPPLEARPGEKAAVVVSADGKTVSVFIVGADE